MHELFAALARNAAMGRNRPAVSDDGSVLGYAELAGRVAGLAEEIAALPPVIGLVGSSGIDWVAAQLACWLAGKTVVPLPAFFRPVQLEHILADAGVGHVLAARDAAAWARRLPLPTTPVSERRAARLPELREGAGQIVYTSGATGRPKGVKLGSAQLAWSARALAEATRAAATDLHLSVMPLALLLETVSAVMVPILAGASVRLEPAIAEAGISSAPGGLAEAFGRVEPTTSVLVPHLLAAWVGELTAAGRPAPGSLRFIAVGGGHVSRALAARAWRLGIPVHEGYGLAECSSVVAVNRPHARKLGTVGRPLAGLSVHIDDGEIVVQGAAVMDGYVRGRPVEGQWRTGDLGTIDGDGFLSVHGRRDNVLVTALGRTISPEWIEGLLADDPRIAEAAVAGERRAHLAVLLVPSAAGEPWFARAEPREVTALIGRLCREVPVHAVPRRFLVVTAAKLKRLGLAGREGRLRRAATLDFFSSEIDGLYAPPPARAVLEARP